MKQGHVSDGGSWNYAELCIVAKNEEKRLADLKKRREYSKLHIPAVFKCIMFVIISFMSCYNIII